MGFYKRIWITIDRNNKKAISLFVILFLLGTLISGAGLSVVILAVSMSSIYIWQLSPKDILSK